MMQASASFPAALGSSKWIASFLAKHRNDDDIYVRSSETRPSKNEAKFQKLYQKTTAELRNVFSNQKSSSDFDPDVVRTAATPTVQNGEQETKSIWTTLFDTKSGNKLHKRAQSAPANHYVPHVLETIGEEQESQEILARKYLPQAAQDGKQESKTFTTALQDSGSRSSDDEDNASIRTTCTVIIRQATMNDEADEIRTDAHEGRESTLHTSNQIKTISSDRDPSQASPETQIECSGALLTPSMMEEWCITNPAPKQKKKQRSSVSSILSIIRKAGKLAKEQPITKQNTKHQRSRLRHKPMKLVQWHKNRPTEDQISDDSHPTIEWDLPQEDNAMGNLIRDFSGPLTTSNNEFVAIPRSTERNRNITNVSAFDKSVDDLLPMPAKRPTSGRLISAGESMADFDDSIHNPKLRSKGNHAREATNKDDSSIMSDEVAHAVPVNETEAQAYDRHYGCIQRVKDMYDRQGIDRTGKFLDYEPSLREGVEQRQIREMTEDFEQPPTEIQPEDTEENDTHDHEACVPENAAKSVDNVQEKLEVNDAPVHEAPECEVTTPSTAAGVSTQGTRNEQLDEHKFVTTPTCDPSSTSDWSNDDDDILPKGAPLTQAAMKDHQNEEYSAFFKSPQNVREKSPDRFCGRQGSLGVKAWLDKTRKHADDWERDAATMMFDTNGASSDSNDDTLSELGYYPSKAEAEIALNHPDAPKIQGVDPEEAKHKWNTCIQSITVASTAKAGLQAEVLSALTRNELIEDAHDRADRVTYLFLQKKAQQTDESKTAERRHVRKVCREFEKALEEVQRRARLANKEAADASRCIRYLQRSYDEMEENIHRFTESLGYERADNIVDAMELIKKTEREENIDFRQIERLDRPEPESPDSYGASEYYRCDAEQDDNVKLEDPTDIFF